MDECKPLMVGRSTDQIFEASAGRMAAAKEEREDYRKKSLVDLEGRLAGANLRSRWSST